jgi:hypothetical protein
MTLLPSSLMFGNFDDFDDFDPFDHFDGRKRQWNSKIYTKKDYDNGFDSNKLFGIRLVNSGDR